MTISNLEGSLAIRLAIIGQQSLIHYSLAWPKMKFKKDFLNIFYFAFLFFQALFKIWISNKFKIILVILISDFLSYSIVSHYTQFIYYYTHKIFEVMVGATLMKNLGSPVPKQSGVFRKIRSSKQHESFCGLSNRLYKHATCFST